MLFRSDPGDGPAWRQTTGDGNMGDVMARAHADQFIEIGVHGDEIDAEGTGGELPRRLDLSFERQIGRRRVGKEGRTGWSAEQ